MEQPGAILNLNQVQEQAAQAAPSPTARRGACRQLHYRALDWNFNNMQNPTTWKASASYVTGAHNMKISTSLHTTGPTSANYYNATRLNYRFLSGAEPADAARRLPDQGPQPVSRRLRAGPVDGQPLTLVGAISTIVRGAGRLRVRVPMESISSARLDILPAHRWCARLQRHHATHGRSVRLAGQWKDR